MIGSLKRSIGLVALSHDPAGAIAELRADVDWLLTFVYALIGFALIVILFKR